MAKNNAAAGGQELTRPGVTAVNLNQHKLTFVKESEIESKETISLVTHPDERDLGRKRRSSHFEGSMAHLKPKMVTSDKKLSGLTEEPDVYHKGGVMSPDHPEHEGTGMEIEILNRKMPSKAPDKNNKDLQSLPYQSRTATQPQRKNEIRVTNNVSKFELEAEVSRN